LTYPGKWDNLQEMERTPIPGGFLIEMSPEEIQQLIWLNEISHHLALTAMKVSQRDLSSDFKEIQGLNSDIKKHIEIVDSLMKDRQT
jgi:hypothetical protein